jgi:GDP-4-dehydro-6-deoxy-D-mannose reductase
MRVLITGMNGFAGSALCDFLLEQTHWMLIGVGSSTSGERLSGRIQWWQLDLTDPDGIRRLIKFERPDLIFHLAAQANVPKSWENPWDTFEVNVRGTLNLFDAVVVNHCTPRIVVVSSNEVYGSPLDSSDTPFKEDHPLHPNNPYGVSKVAQEKQAMQYRYSHGLDVLVARPFNHIGPRQKPDYVIASFARQIAEIEAGLHEPILNVGNMQAQRDFTDVQDTVRAYYMLARYADGGKTYNVSSGIPRSIQSILDLMLSMSTTHIETRSDPTKFRISDAPISFGDSSLLKNDTGWVPQIPFEKTIADVLAAWRLRIAETQSNQVIPSQKSSAGAFHE